MALPQPPSPPIAPPTTRDWHARSSTQALKALDSHLHGLSGVLARHRLEQHGPNRMPEAPAPSAWRRLARQFNNLLLMVLIAAAAITALMGHTLDSAVIAAVVLLNAVIGFAQEGKAERALQAIHHMLAPHAVVLRDGHQHDVDASELVPGDVVLLTSGDRVPADLRLLHARNLRVDESALTGESGPVDKHTEAVDAGAAIGDRSCLAHAGTLVIQGQAKGVVVATGEHTEIGRIGHLLATVGPGTTPLLQQMDAFGRRLTLIILTTAALLFAFGTSVRGLSTPDAFLAAIGLAVAAIPEGLPAILTITLAIGVQRMARRHAVVRRLPAVETLGSVTVICSDKTGTLTRNEMTVQGVVTAAGSIEVDGAGYAPQGALRMAGRALDPNTLAHQHPVLRRLVEAGALCNDASLHDTDDGWVLAGDPTEGALLTLALKAGLSSTALNLEQPRRDVIPFESEHRFMATLHQAREGRVFVKGAPERVLAMCHWQATAHGPEPLESQRWQAAVEAQARDGRRVLALAELAWPHERSDLQHADIDQGLTLLGIVGIIDPSRDEARTAVARCQAAGIRVVMITGDHAVTARAIAKSLCLLGPDATDDDAAVVSGPDLDRLDDADLQVLLRQARVFARASPEHKLRLVRALQAGGEVVAMTGDGVNDAPALKQADVGVAMGRKGTDAARQSGAVVLADDNFASIAHAVEEGRTAYDNLRKTVTFLLPVNGGESLTLLVAVLLGVALPILPAQVLWVNMVSSVALAMVLAFEPTENDVMRRPPRPPKQALLSTFLVWRIALVSTLFLLGIFGTYEWALRQGASTEAARTLAVNTLVCMEVAYLFSVRYLKAPAFTWRGVRGTPRVLAAVAGVLLLQALFTWAPPLQRLFQTEGLPLTWTVLIGAVGLAVLLLLEAEKALLRRYERAKFRA
ncbi:MAG: HAD-IC family P-type ATPase [Inhella sp.]|jgi:magnesium-transporting ATPase (P-type)|uniref:HAD-IC family P-type ATPase n=1 Tax=Inhella sp. TaxID=1921806 RepID=UPI0022C4CE67|nr:HAD-IC family P-type ATPase [Inhella sp.]MCZ8233786.1 HAD-IC family P-type ATPase [Inhella sp.]